MYNFKVGDRVVVIGGNRHVGGIFPIHSFIPTNREYIIGLLISNETVSSFKPDHLVPERVYNSKLYKVLK